MRSTAKLLTAAGPLALAALLTTSAAVHAAPRLTAEGAMRKGVRDAARIEAHGAKPSLVAIRCGPLGPVGHTARCRGTFRLTHDGRQATYALTAKAGVFHNTPGSLEYRVRARAERRTSGLPARIDLAGFLQ